MFTPQFLLIGLAIFMAIIYLPAFVNPQKFRKTLKSFCSEIEVVRLSGAFCLLLSMMFLSVHWKFSDGWMMMISIIGWIILIKGVLWVWNPELIKRIVKKSSLFNTDTGIAIVALIAIIMAAALIYIATEVFTVGELISG